MANVILDWPAGLQESITDELVQLGIDEGVAEMAVDIVASRLVVEFATGRIQVEKVDRSGGESDD